jgi:predicted DNA-binding transcriptional regulator AlpA
MSQTQQAFSVAQFCAAHGFTKPTFYALLKQSRGPRIMKVGSRTLISVEAAADWRAAMEKEAHILPARRAISA